MLEYHLSEIDNSRLLFLPVSVHEYLQPESRWLGSASKRVIGISGELLHKIHLKEGLSLQKGVVLHSDNGSPMKGATMLATMQKRGVIPSFRRPSVSNNNAYSESLFKTMKYTPAFPDQPFSFCQKRGTGWPTSFNGTTRNTVIVKFGM